MLDVACPGGEDQIVRAFGAGEPMLTQHGDDSRGQGDGALARLRLGRPIFVAVRALADVSSPRFKIDVCPAQAAQLGRSQPGEDRRQEQWTPAAAGAR